VRARAATTWTGGGVLWDARCLGCQVPLSWERQDALATTTHTASHIDQQHALPFRSSQKARTQQEWMKMGMGHKEVCVRVSKTNVGG
jgi:hypothetical protein